MRKILYQSLLLLLLASCGSGGNEEAQRMLQHARQMYDKGEYAATLSAIDSLRHAHPTAIEERKAALKLYQDAAEKMAQQEVARLDMELQQAEHRLDSMQAAVDKAGTGSGTTERQLLQLARMRQKRDSLKVAFDTQCATVRLVRERRKS